MDRFWISIVVGIGGFSVALLSLYLGYKLILTGATAATRAGAEAATVFGLGLAVFGAILSIYTIRKLMGSQRRETPPSTKAG